MSATQSTTGPVPATGAVPATAAAIRIRKADLAGVNPI